MERKMTAKYTKYALPSARIFAAGRVNINSIFS